MDFRKLNLETAKEVLELIGKARELLEKIPKKNRGWFPLIWSSAKISQETLAEMIGTTRSSVRTAASQVPQFLLNLVLHEEPHIENSPDSIRRS